MAEKSITCHTFYRPDVSMRAVHRSSPVVNSSAGFPVMEFCGHCKDFFGRYASPVWNDKVNMYDATGSIVNRPSDTMQYRQFGISQISFCCSFCEAEHCETGKEMLSCFKDGIDHKRKHLPASL